MHPVNPAPLPGRIEYPADRRLQAGVRIRDHQLQPAQPPGFQAAQKLGPERFCLGRADGQADDLAPPIRVHRDSDYRRHRDDPPALAHLQTGRIQPQVGPLTGQRAVEKLMHPLVYVLAELGNCALGNARQPHGLHQIVDLPRRDAADPYLLNDGHQRLLRRAARLQKAREV